MTLPTNSDCLIIGGGVIGLSIAYEMAKRGNQVQILDQALVGRGASWAGAGILPPSPTQGALDPLDQLRGLSHQLHPVWAEELKQFSGIDTGFQRCGGIYLARTPAEAATLAAQRSLWQEHGIEAEQWTTADAMKREPSLRPLLESNRVCALWHMPDECQLRNPWHLQALIESCRRLGVSILENQRVDAIQPHESHTQVVANGHAYRSAAVCICSGAWSRILLDQLHITTGVMPVRGQMILYKSQSPLLGRVVNEGHRYLVARSDGHLLAGSCEEEVGYDTSTTETMIAQLKHWAESILDALRSTPIERTWAGLRPGSFDTLPYMGLVPGTQGLYVATGHFRAGLHLSCATATVMADLMQGKKPSLDLTPFRIMRG